MESPVSFDISSTTTDAGPQPETGTVADDQESRPSRRRLLLGLTAAGGAAAAAAAGTEAEAATDPVLHLLRRATYGPTPELVAEVRAMGATAWLDLQLTPTKIPDPVVDGLLGRWPGRNWKTWECRERVAPSERWNFSYGTPELHVARALWSRRQLLEVVVNFWNDHLVVPMPNADVYDCGHLFQRDVLRRYAFSPYTDLLAAAVRHPALLVVLDNADSGKQAPNENHARELLELHTVGVGGYTEADVKATARVLTGLSIDRESGLYEFKPWRHHVGPVKVLGWSHDNASAEGGEAVALSLLSYLAKHPRTARRIVTKLAVRFVSDAPPATLIDELAAVYTSKGTAIAPVLKALFTSTAFAAAAGKKVRTPYEDVMATLRVVGAQPPATGTKALRDLLYQLRRMGQVPMGWPAPDGYPDTATAWAGASSTLHRWNVHIGVLGGWLLSSLPRPAVATLLPKTLPTTYGAYVDALAARLLMAPLPSAHRTALCSYLSHEPQDRLGATDPAVTWRLPYVAALLLDSPNFAAR